MFGALGGEGGGDPEAGAGWGSSLWLGSPRHFRPPQSLETRTSLSHPRCPPSSRGRPPSGRREEAASSIVRCGPWLRPGCRKRPCGHWPSLGLSQTRRSGKLPWAVASGLGLVPPPQMRSLESNRGEGAGPAARTPAAPAPQPQTAGPSNLPGPSHPLTEAAPAAPPSGWKDPQTSHRPGRSHCRRVRETQPREEAAAATTQYSHLYADAAGVAH